MAFSASMWKHSNSRAAGDVRYEIARLKKSLLSLARFREVDREETLRKGGSPNRISLRARVGEWPPDATLIRFTWRVGSEELRSEERRVDPGSGTGRSPISSEFDAAKRGSYSCVVVAEDADGIEVAKGTSRVAAISVVARCARCRGDFDVDEQESASFPEGRAGKAERLSRACEWTSSLVPREAPTLKTFETFGELARFAWDITRFGEDEQDVSEGSLLFAFVKGIHEGNIGRWTLGDQPQTLEKLLISIPHYDVLMGLQALATSLRDNFGDGEKQRRAVAPFSASFASAHSLVEKLHASFAEFAELVADASTDRFPFSASTSRMKTAPRPGEGALAPPPPPRFDPFSATGVEIRALLPRHRPEGFDVDSLFSRKRDGRSFSVLHEERPGRPKKYVGPHSESSAPDEIGISIPAHDEPEGEGWIGQRKASPLNAVEELVTEFANRAVGATFRPGSIEASKVEEKEELWRMAAASFEKIAKEADLDKETIEAIRLEEIAVAFAQ